MKDTNRYRIDVLLQIARITERGYIREQAIDEVMLLLPNVYINEKHAGGRPRDALESAKADLVRYLAEKDEPVLSEDLRKEMLKRGHKDNTISVARSELIKDEIIIKVHNGKRRTESRYLYSLNERSK